MAIIESALIDNLFLTNNVFILVQTLPHGSLVTSVLVTYVGHTQGYLESLLSEILYIL